MDVTTLLTLRPGDRRIRSVGRCGPPEGDPWWVERTCERCGRRVDAESASVLRYGPHGAGAIAKAVLCSYCAVLLTPFRLAVDLRRVQELDTSDPVGCSLIVLVQRILDLRSQPPTDELCLRAADVTALASGNTTTRTHLALDLDELGVLVSVDVAIKQVVSVDVATKQVAATAS